MANLFNVVLFSYSEETIYTSAILFAANVFHNAIECQRDLNLAAPYGIRIAKRITLRVFRDTVELLELTEEKFRGYSFKASVTDEEYGVCTTYTAA